MIDLSCETLIGLAEAARRLPFSRLGRPVSPSCVWRWVRDGVLLSSGERLRLEAIRLGGRWLTSLEALQRFADAQTPVLADEPKTPRTPTTRRRASERAAAELDRLGL